MSDSLSLRASLGYELHESPPEHSTISRTRRRLGLEVHKEVFGWVLEQLQAAGLAQGRTVAVDATLLFANAALRTLRRKGSWVYGSQDRRRLRDPTLSMQSRFPKSQGSYSRPEQRNLTVEQANVLHRP